MRRPFTVMDWRGDCLGGLAELIPQRTGGDMRRALAVFPHQRPRRHLLRRLAQDPRLTAGAQMHEGVVSAELGLAGWPAVAEESIILAPIPRPAKNIFCVGKNYHEHAKEFASSGFDAICTSTKVNFV